MAALFVVAALYARHYQAASLADYDDEGCMLISLLHYLAGERLYTQVFSYYGPLHFLLQEAIFRGLGLAVTHDAGRLVTLICWMLTAVLAGGFVYRVSRQVWLAAGAFLGCTLLLSFLAAEPGHPQQWILVFLAAAAYAAAQRGSGTSALALLGALGAALVFLKINVGVFYCAALAQALAAAFAPGRWKQAATAVAFLAALGLPAAVALRSPGGMRFGALTVISGVAAFWAARMFSPVKLDALRSTAAAVAGAIGAGLLIAGASVAAGISPSSLVDGVLWIPLRQGSPFAQPLWVGKSTVALSVAALAGVVALGFLREGWRKFGDWLDLARLAVGAWAAFGLIASEHATLVRLIPLLPLSLVPPRGGAWRPADFWPRMFLTLLAGAEFLQTYPVAGGQAGVAGLLVLVWAFLCIHDGCEGAFALGRRISGAPGRAVLRPWVVGAAATACYAAAMLAHGPIWTYAYPPSHLRGSASLHLPPAVETRFERLSAVLQANCGVLTSLPGLASLNLWSAVPAPNGLNLTNWMKVLTAEQQSTIVDRLAGDRRSCAVSSDSLLQFWKTPRESLHGAPLAEYILFHMRKIGEVDGYEIRVHPEREGPWLWAEERRRWQTVPVPSLMVAFRTDGLKYSFPSSYPGAVLPRATDF